MGERNGREEAETMTWGSSSHVPTSFPAAERAGVRGGGLLYRVKGEGDAGESVSAKGERGRARP